MSDNMAILYRVHHSISTGPLRYTVKDRCRREISLRVFRYSNYSYLYQIVLRADMAMIKLFGYILVKLK